MRGSNPGEGVFLTNLRPQIPKSFMRSSNPVGGGVGEGGIHGLQRIGYSWDFEHKIFSPKVGPVSKIVSHTMRVETNQDFISYYFQ